MISNGDVEINGSVTVQTEPIGNKNAHIRANGNINVSGGAASVDGRVAAAGTVTMSNGVSSDALFPTGQSGAARIAFPSEATVRAWKNEWTTAARAGSVVNATDIFAGGKKNATITGPAYINGSLDMSGGETLTITGAGPIYITGDVTMRGNSTMVNTSHVIVGGTFRQVGTTLADGSPGGENPKYEANPATGETSPALISLSKHLTEAITLTGNATNNQFSVIYAVHGGITVHGTVEVRGSLVAGGEGADIIATGNYTHSYPDGAVTGSPFARAPIVTSWIEL